MQQMRNFISMFAGAQCSFSKGSIRYEQTFSIPNLPIPLQSGSGSSSRNGSMLTHFCNTQRSQDTPHTENYYSKLLLPLGYLNNKQKECIK